MKTNKEIEAIEISRFSGLCEQIDHYGWMQYDGIKLSKIHIDHLNELINKITCFGQKAIVWVNSAKEIIKNNKL